MKVFGIIYRLKNKVNGKIYVGQTTKSLEHRILSHFSADHPRHLNTKFNQYIHRAIRKYGKDKFEYRQICECYSREDLNWAEQYFIQEFYDSWNSSKGYNIAGGGSSGDTLSHHPNRVEIGARISRTSIENKSHAGERNGRYGTSLKEQMISKYGQFVGEQKFKNWQTKHSLNMSSSKNRWFGKSIYEIWVEKYGSEIADEKRKKSIASMSQKLRNLSPEINAKKACPGSKNGMFGISVYDKWVQKYGKQEADLRHEQRISKLKETIKKNKERRLTAV